MSRTLHIRTTIPPRTYGQGRKSSSPHSLLLRMSYLELERQRRIQETEQLQARTIKLRTRIEEIEREKAALQEMLEAKVTPLDAANAVPVSRAALPSAASHSAARARVGLAIRY